MAYREYRKARPTPYGKLTDPQAEPLDQSAADCIITQLMDVKEHLD